MYSIDNSTAAQTQPASTPAGTSGYFTDGNAATGVSPTIVPAEFLNMVMMELLNVVSGAGITPSKSENTQVLTAIRTLSRQQTIMSDVGAAANIYAAVNTLPLTALPTASGVVQRFVVSHTNTAASTYSPDALAAAPIFSLAGLALQGNEMVANGTAIVVSYVGPLLNSGALCWVLIECTGGATPVVPATKSNHAPQAGQVATGALGTATAGGTANAITASFPAAPTAFVAGQPFTIIAAAANTGAVTAVVTLGGTAQTSVPVVKGANQALVAGDIPAAGYPGEYSYSAAYGALVMQNPSTGVVGSAGRLINTIYCSVVTQTVTATIASPGVFTGALGASSMPQNGSPIVFTTTGALPTGLTAGATYWVVNRNTTAGTFQVSATLGGTSITTSGSQSGTHTMSNPAYTKATNSPSFVITEVWGGGGGSGGIVASTAYGTGGGGAGGYTRQKLLNASILTSETVTVGAGGTAGASTGTAGGAGGSSSFGSHSSATGGGGSTGNNTTTSGSGAGASGGIGSGGDLNLTGAAGGNGAGNNTYGSAGNGGASTLGGNGLGAGASTTGGGAVAANGNPAAANSASGAGGAWEQVGSAVAGAAGGSGLVIVYEYS